MRKVIMVSTVAPEKCVGCGFCITRCIFDAIHIGEDHKAIINENTCMGCIGCLDICPNQAISTKMLDEPRMVETRTDDVDPKEIAALCRKVGRDPERIICQCSRTKAKEVAAAIIKGAKTVAEVGAVTGIKVTCQMHCTMPVLDMLEAYGYEQKPTDNNGAKFYKCGVRLDTLSDEILEKYPQYYLKEDLEAFKQNELPFLAEMF